MAVLRVMRLCSVFEPGEPAPGSARFDPVGGMQNHTAELTRWLDRMGVRQVVLTSRLAGPAGRVRFGVGAEVIRTGVHMRVFRQGWAPLALRPAVGGGPVDVVHAHCGEDLAVLPLAGVAARRHGCPLVVTVHLSVAHTLRVSSPRTALLRVAGGAAERRFLPAARAVITLTPSAARRLRRDGIRPERLHVIPSGYDPGLFSAAGPDPFPGVPRPRVGYVGRLAAQKRVGTLVKAFGYVTRRAQLLVVGDGPGRAALERRARPLGDRARFTGFVPHAQVPAVLGHLDVLVLCSVYEELGSVLVEAMACGLPVVATAVGGVPDLVHDNINGLLVPPGNPAALGAAINRVLGDPATASRLSAGARRTAQDYAWPALARRVLDLYWQVTSPSGDPGPC